MRTEEEGRRPVPDILDRLQPLFRDVLDNPSLTVTRASSGLNVPGWDSLSHTLLMLEIESAFGVQIDLEKVAGCADIGQLVSYIDSLK